ncbi:hypothetical protein BN1200_1030001 [Klebsiella variicola]|nr:hypothetical protein BN1200_1030001 [Klebsiella variicola]
MTGLSQPPAWCSAWRLQIPALRACCWPVSPGWLLAPCRWQQGNMFRYHPRRIRKPPRLPKEKSELDADYQGEVRELTSLYIQRGVEPALARQVAEQLMAKDRPGGSCPRRVGINGYSFCAYLCRRPSFSAV